VIVLLVWIGRYQGNLIRGMHTTTISLLPEISKFPYFQTSGNKKISVFPDISVNNRVAVDYLSIGLNHCDKIKFNYPQLFIPVAIDIKSNNMIRKIIFSIDIIKNSYNNDPQNESNIYENGLSWGNKTSFLDIELLPCETKTIQFLAVISKPGMFDLNR
jgi:hypothetical protein